MDQLDQATIEELHSALNARLSGGDDADDKRITYILLLLYKQTHSTEHLEGCLRTASASISKCVVSESCQSKYLQRLEQNLASTWRNSTVLLADSSPTKERLYTLTMDLIAMHDTLDNHETAETVICIQQILSVEAERHADRFLLIFLVATVFWLRYQLRDNVDDLNAGIELAYRALSIVSFNGPDSAQRLDRLFGWLKLKIDMLGSTEDINKAIECATAAFELSNGISVSEITELTLIDDLGQAQRLSRLGVMYGLSYDRTDQCDDIDHAMKLCNKALVSVPPSSHIWHELSCNVASVLGQKFKRTGMAGDVDQALTTVSTVLENTTSDHSTHALASSICADLLEAKFERFGSVEDLNDAVARIQDSLAATKETLTRPQRLNTLGSLLVIRYRRLQAMEDLDEGIESLKSALDLESAQRQPDRMMWSNNFAIALGQRHKHSHVSQDLDLAIAYLPTSEIEKHTAASTLLSTRGIRLLDRYGENKISHDLDQSIECFEKAMSKSSPDNSDWYSWSNNLAHALGSRFEKQNTTDDLNRAILVLDSAFKQMPKDHPDRATILGNLGRKLRERFYYQRKASDLKRSLAAFKEGWRCDNAAPSFRIHLARDAATILAAVEDWDEALEVLDAAVRLLPILSPRTLRNADKQRVLAEYAGLASLATSVALNAGKQPFYALELLEIGRSIISSLVIGARTDISDLKRTSPELANEYESLRDELDSSSESDSLLQAVKSRDKYGLRVQRRYEAEREFNRIIMMIRDQEGFHDFLLPPTEAEMIAEANPDPMIVINISLLRCDVLIVEYTGIKLMTLPNIDLVKVRDKTTPEGLKFSHSRLSLLEWLWDAIACPIMETLNYRLPYSGDDAPHVWWIPTGPFCHLPLHAAGYHELEGAKTVLDRVSSSYSLSIKTLIYGRRRHRGVGFHHAHDQALVVSMSQTPRHNDLPFAIDETEVVKRVFTLLGLQYSQPFPKKDDVLKLLYNCQIFHFAGHGRIDHFEPSRSALLLEDWESNPLTVEDLRSRRPDETLPFLGYLSACSTGAVGDKKFLDEGISLISACQLAGFRHVIGTLWSVSDKHCVDIAIKLYESIQHEGMTDVAVHRGLHKAIKALRDKEIGQSHDNDTQGSICPSTGTSTSTRIRDAGMDDEEDLRGMVNDYWVPYVHIGI